MALGFRPALLLGMLVGVLALVAGKEKKAASTEGATSSGASSTAAHVHNGPYAPIAGMISDTKKKSSFYNVRPHRDHHHHHARSHAIHSP